MTCDVRTLTRTFRLTLVVVQMQRRGRSLLARHRQACGCRRTCSRLLCCRNCEWLWWLRLLWLLLWLLWVVAVVLLVVVVVVVVAVVVVVELIFVGCGGFGGIFIDDTADRRYRCASVSAA